MRGGRTHPARPEAGAVRDGTPPIRLRRRPTVAAALALVVLLPTVGAMTLATIYAAGGWSARGAWAQIQSASAASEQLTELHAESVTEGTATMAIATAHDLGMSPSTLATMTGVDFEASMLSARRIIDADPTLHAYPQLAGDVGRLDQLRRDVDANLVSAPAAVAMFSAFGADINALWLARFNDIGSYSGRIGNTGTIGLYVQIMQLTHEALSASIDRTDYTNDVVRGQATPANLTALIDANSRYATALSDISGRYGPKATAAWKALQADPATVRVEAIIAQTVTDGLTGAPSPFGTDLTTYSAAFASGAAWEARVTALAVAASDDVHDLAARQDAAATREFLAALAAAAIVLGAAVGGAALAATSITRPLRRLAASAAEITGGHFAGPEIPVGGPREVAQTSAAVNDMRATLVAVESLTATLPHDPGWLASDQPLPGRTGQSLPSAAVQLRYPTTPAGQQRARLLEITTRDHLSGLLNRSAALDAISRNLTRARRDHTPVSVLFMDLDGLKAINDTHSHAAGDRAITAAAKALRAATGDDDIVARLGGDEFLVSTAGQTPADTEMLAERIREAVAEETIAVKGGLIPLACSIGVARARPDDTVDSLIHHADHALHEAKQHGGNQVAVYHAAEASTTSA